MGGEHRIRTTCEILGLAGGPAKLRGLAAIPTPGRLALAGLAVVAAAGAAHRAAQELGLLVGLLEAVAAPRLGCRPSLALGLPLWRALLRLGPRLGLAVAVGGRRGARRGRS